MFTSLSFLLLSLPFLSAQQIEFNDINLLVVTDAHSWISSHIHPDHDPLLNAGYGDIASSVEHLKSLAKAQGRDVFFLNNGDHVEGSGLSDASVYTNGVHGFDLFPLISMMPFDALNIGNHDLYDDATIDFMNNNNLSGPYDANGEQSSPFIEAWGGRYLTSNTLNATTLEPVASTSVILTGENAGTKLLLFGFLYHMTDSCDAVVVQDPVETVAMNWFADALKNAMAEDVDAIVVLSQ
jgi:2',3'-cyclic-nucleotide 2'-phosphodiesterase (5'-nucleotidase family)